MLNKSTTRHFLVLFGLPLAYSREKILSVFVLVVIETWMPILLWLKIFFHINSFSTALETFIIYSDIWQLNFVYQFTRTHAHTHI